MFDIRVIESAVINHGTATAEAEFYAGKPVDGPLTDGKRRDGLTPTRMLAAVGVDETVLGDVEFYGLVQSWDDAYCAVHYPASIYA